MALIIWILPIQVFRTTVVLVVMGAIGFVVFLRQLAAESGAPPDATRRARTSTSRRLVERLRSACGAAVAAVPVEHDLVRPHAVVESPCGLLERPFEAGIGERLDLPAVVADEVMMVLAVQV